MVRLSRLQDLPEVGSGPLVVCSLLLSALSLFSWCIACKYGSISRFKGVFSAVYSVRVGLCCLGALRGLCGLCTRVELGGFRACGVFASIYPFICLCLPFSFSLCLRFLSFFALVVFACPLSCFVFVFSFSLSDYTQKERALRVGASSLVLLWAY